MTAETRVGIACGVTVAGLGVRVLLDAAPGDLATPIPWVLAAVHFVVCVLFVRRARATKVGGWRGILTAAPSVVLAGLFLHMAGPPSGWPPLARVLFCVAGMFTVVSLVRLGRCFAIFPAVRGLVTAGPYRWVRHPVYAGELAMAAAAVFATGVEMASALLWVCTAMLLALRIRFEERLLREQHGFAAYRERVRWRLCPMVW